MHPRMDLAVLSQNQEDRQYHPVTNGSRALTPHEKNYHLTKLKFLALKWEVTEHFKEYLLYSILPGRDRQQSIDLHNDDT